MVSKEKSLKKEESEDEDNEIHGSLDTTLLTMD